MSPILIRAHAACSRTDSSRSFNASISASTALTSPIRPRAHAARSRTTTASYSSASINASTALVSPISPRASTVFLRTDSSRSFSASINASTALVSPISPRAPATFLRTTTTASFNFGITTFKNCCFSESAISLIASAACLISMESPLNNSANTDSSDTVTSWDASVPARYMYGSISIPQKNGSSLNKLLKSSFSWYFCRSLEFFNSSNSSSAYPLASRSNLQRRSWPLYFTISL